MSLRIVAPLLALSLAAGCYRSHRLTDGSVGPDGGVVAPVGDGEVPHRDAGAPPPPRPDAGPETEPEPPPPGARVAQLAAGRDHVCARTEDGAVYCWGSNDVGQCAAGTRITQGTPARVRGLPPVVDIDTMDGHTCAIARDASLWCWGFSAYGQLAVSEGSIPDCGRAECSRIPLRSFAPPVDGLAVGFHATVARLVDGEVAGWGRDAAARAALEAELFAPRDVDLGMQHGCALTADGALRCFGESDFGRLGDGDRDDGVVDLERVASFEVGAEHTCAIDGDDLVWCWGYDWAGSLGRPKRDLEYCVHGDTGGECARVPVQPTGEPRAAQVSVGARRSCVLDLDGQVWCWGAWTVNGGVSTCGSRPGECDHVLTEVEGLVDVVAIEVGASVACALQADGAVWCWGWNGLRQLGDGSRADEITDAPVRVAGFGD